MKKIFKQWHHYFIYCEVETENEESGECFIWKNSYQVMFEENCDLREAEKFMQSHIQNTQVKEMYVMDEIVIINYKEIK